MPRQVYRVPGIKPLNSGKYQARVFHHGFEESRTFRSLDDAKRWQRNLKKDLERAPSGINRKRGAWLVSVISPSGVYSRSFDSLEPAVLWLNSSTAAIAGGGDVPSDKAPLSLLELVTRWRNSHPSQGKKAFATYNSQLRRHILPLFGDRTIGGITKSDIQDWVLGLSKSGVGATTAIASYKLLHQILEFAVDRGHLDVNPCHKVRLPSKVSTPKGALTKEELLNLAAECGEYQGLILLLGTTGLRIGEALALNIGDIDFRHHVIRVDKAVTTGERGELPTRFGSTKTGTARKVPVSPAVLDLVSPGGDVRHQEDPLFRGIGGGRLNYGWFRRTVFVPAKIRAGLPDISIHTLRHTCASLLIQRGAPVTTVSHILGHASVKMTLDVYSHFYETDTEVWANRLAADLFPETQ